LRQEGKPEAMLENISKGKIIISWFIQLLTLWLVGLKILFDKVFLG
jgi:hypothetical protein